MESLSMAIHAVLEHPGEDTASALIGAYATAVEKTGDSKLSKCSQPEPCRKPNGSLKTGCQHARPISVTHAAKLTCPTCCPYLKAEFDGTGAGCYADNGPQGWTTRRLSRAGVADGATPIDVALVEAWHIDRLSGRYPLRAHVVGDCPDDISARIVSDAIERYKARHGQSAWTYTHAWRTVDRASWQSVSVLASCETSEDVAEATGRGYAVAIVRPRGQLPLTIAGQKVIPCPQQSGAVLDCANCGRGRPFCTRDTSLLGHAVIGFQSDGNTDSMIQAAITRRESGD